MKKTLINKKELYTILKNAINTSSSDIFLKELNSVHFDFLDNKKLNIVFTDSKQIAIYTINYKGKKLNSFTIKSNNIKALLKYININSINKNIYIAIDNKDFNYIKIDNIIYEKINNFPNYKSIIPNEENNKKLYSISLNNENMIKIKKAIRSIQKYKIRKNIIIHFKKDKIILTIDDNLSPHIIIDNIKSNIDYMLCLDHRHIINILHQCINKDNNNKINLEVYKDKNIKIINNNNTFICMHYIAENI